MSIYFDITTPNLAYSFLVDTLNFRPDDLIIEYIVECNKDLDLFWERNKNRLDGLDIHDLRFVAFHITGSLDNCREIKMNGIRNLQYVLSHNTLLSKMLEKGGICFDVENRVMVIDGIEYNIDYDYYRNNPIRSTEEAHLKSVAHRLYYDHCIDGFFVNDRIEDYGTRIHERPEFIHTLIELSPNTEKLDAFWSAKSAPYKVVFFATVDQIHKFTFDLEKNYCPYTEYEQDQIKKWMLTNAVERAFEPCGTRSIYIRDDEYIRPQQIICCEKMN